jgi:translation initiation factor IF-3
LIIARELRRNHAIRISPIRLIDENDAQIGVVELSDALQRAYDADMDLVEVAPGSKPPVCRIMDYGKYKYQQQKKEQKAKAQRHETELKQIRIRTPKIGDHDLMIKVNHARQFLERGDRVAFSLRFRGRELAHIDEGRGVFDRIVEALKDVARVDQRPRFEGRRLGMMLIPLPKQTRDHHQQAAQEQKQQTQDQQPAQTQPVQTQPTQEPRD